MESDLAELRFRFMYPKGCGGSTPLIRTNLSSQFVLTPISFISPPRFSINPTTVPGATIRAVAASTPVSFFNQSSINRHNHIALLQPAQRCRPARLQTHHVQPTLARLSVDLVLLEISHAMAVIQGQHEP